MKKTLLAFLVFTLIFSFGGVSFAQEVAPEPPLLGNPPQNQNQEQGMQRIPSPDHIQDFKNIKKVGNALMGVPRDQRGGNSGNQIKPKGEKPPKNTASTSTLEKIPHPNEIKNFEKVQKIGPALYGVRKGGAPKPPVYVSAEAVACVKAAIDKKDLAEKTGITARSEKAFAVIDARNTCQKSALDKTTAKEQGDANKACANAFQASMTEINESLMQEKKDNWTAYNEDLKSCSALQSTTSTNSNTITIEDGGNTTDTPAQ